MSEADAEDGQRRRREQRPAHAKVLLGVLVGEDVVREGLGGAARVRAGGRTAGRSGLPGPGETTATSKCGSSASSSALRRRAHMSAVVRARG